MVEPSSTGNGNSQKRTTAKLSVNGAEKNTSQAPQTVDSLQLTVIEGFQVGRGVARIDPSDIARLGCQP